MVLEDSFSPEELADLRSRQHETRNPMLLAVLTTMLVLTTLTTALRLYARKHRKAGIQLDDYCIVLALVCYIGLYTSFLLCLPIVGLHITAVSMKQFLSFIEGIPVFVSFYVWGLTLVKFAVLLLFMRIFPVRWLRRCAWVLMFLSFSSGLLYFIFLFTECPPAPVDSPKGCVPLKASLYSTGAVNILCDILIFMLPAPCLFKLRVPRPQRLALFFILLLGLSVCIISILRLLFIPLYDRRDRTWEGVPIALATVLECSLGILCANFPVIYPLFGMLFGGLVPTSYFRSRSRRTGSKGLGSSAHKDNIEAHPMSPIPSTYSPRKLGNAPEEDLQPLKVTSVAENESQTTRNGKDGITVNTNIEISVEQPPPVERPYV